MWLRSTLLASIRMFLRSRLVSNWSAILLRSLPNVARYSDRYPSRLAAFLVRRFSYFSNHLKSKSFKIIPNHSFPHTLYSDWFHQGSLLLVPVHLHQPRVELQEEDVPGRTEWREPGQQPLSPRSTAEQFVLAFFSLQVEIHKRHLHWMHCDD